MVFRELLAYCKAQAIKNTLLPSEESVWFGLCMAYSRQFHTPLMEVLKLDPEHVMMAEFLSQLEGVNIEKHIDSILDQIYTLENPEYQRNKAKDLDDFIAMAEKEEEERVKAGKPIPKTKRPLLKGNLPEVETKPTGGSVDFSNMKEDEEPGDF